MKVIKTCKTKGCGKPHRNSSGICNACSAKLAAAQAAQVAKQKEKDEAAAAKSK